MEKTNSTRTFFVLVAIYALIAGISVFLPQDASGMTVSNQKLPMPVPVIVLVSVLAALIIYGGLGFLGLFLSRKLELPEMWDATISNRQRFLIPALVGFGVAIVIIIGDQIFAPFNGIGHFPHPPFPTSITASIAAGIGEEIMFRLFFTSLWTWLISRIILCGRWQTQVYWVVSIIAAIAFGMGHLPSIMFLYGWTTMEQVPLLLLVEMILLNGIMSLFAAHYFKKYGFLAPVGIHIWADIAWHVIWGLV
jgi:hypothetical protein